MLRGMPTRRATVTVRTELAAVMSGAYQYTTAISYKREAYHLLQFLLEPHLVSVLLLSIPVIQRQPACDQAPRSTSLQGARSRKALLLPNST